MNCVVEVRDFVVSKFFFGEDPGLADDTSFLEESVLDSTGILELVGFLEETYHIRVDDEDLVPENLDSLARISAYVERKTLEGRVEA